MSDGISLCLRVRIIIIVIPLLLLYGLPVGSSVVDTPSNQVLGNSTCPELCKCDNTEKMVDCKGGISIPIVRYIEPRTLNIRNGEITALANDIFKETGLVQLRILNLPNCQIEKIELHAFRGMTALEHLNLSGNKLSDINVNIFVTNIGLQSLLLNFNPNLNKFTGGQFPSLPRLVELRLEHCGFYELSNNTFDNLRNLQAFYLSGNKLQFLPGNFFKQFKQLTILDLENNPWRCDCHLKYMYELYTSRNNIISGLPSCSQPPGLVGRSWKSLNPKDLVCVSEPDAGNAVSILVSPVTDTATITDASHLPQVFHARVNNSQIVTAREFLVKLACDSFGVELTECVWESIGFRRRVFSSKDSKSILLTENRRHDVNKWDNGYCELSIRRVTSEDQTNWKCNLVGTNNSTYHGTVQLRVLACFPQLLSDCCKSEEELEFCIKNQPQILNKDFEAAFYEHTYDELSCRIPKRSDISVTTVEWWRNNKRVLALGLWPLNGRDDNTEEEVLTLEFHNVTLEDAGRYDCVVETPLNRTQQRFVVKVQKVGNIKIRRSASQISAIVGAVIAGLSLIGAIAYFKYWRPCSFDNVGLAIHEMKSFKLDNPAIPGQGRALENIENIPYDQVFEIHRSRFSWDSTAVLGRGAFGIVYRGTFLERSVAIKTVIEPCLSRSSNQSGIYTRALLSEIKVMCYLSSTGTGKNEHTGKSNIVALIGANTKHISKGVYLLCEFCELGSLEGYLRKHRQHFQPIILSLNLPEEALPQALSDQTSNTVITTADLTKWAYEIANGMAYISSRNIIHGDLASRNVLLSCTRAAKISDFGLSRRLYEYSTYTKQNQEPLPWRWMAIESLKDLTFSSQSDVWSYGITIWEIFSLAEIPYPGLNWTIDFADNLEKGIRPTQPKYASTNLYKLMERAWRTDPTQRPNFEQIRVDMRVIFEEFVGQNYESLATLNKSCIDQGEH